MFKNSSNGYNSYMDTTLPFDINDFKRDSPRHSYDGSSSSSMFFFRIFRRNFLDVLLFPISQHNQYK